MEEGFLVFKGSKKEESRIEIFFGKRKSLEEDDYFCKWLGDLFVVLLFFSEIFKRKRVVVFGGSIKNKD